MMATTRGLWRCAQHWVAFEGIDGEGDVGFFQGSRRGDWEGVSPEQSRVGNDLFPNLSNCIKELRFDFGVA
jgi:hypothetical protein